MAFVERLTAVRPPHNQPLQRTGDAIGRASEPVDAWDLRIAPDGRRVAVTEIDPQLRTLDVFIREGVYLEYAQAFLAPEQIAIEMLARPPIAVLA